jgi:hypothetical protein
MLDFANETFNEVPFFVEVPIIVSLFGAVFARRNDRGGTPFQDTLNKVIRIVATVSKHVVALTYEAN